ncbi:hypothetical protein K504DRAFT_130525 [Pleomassaria siparia CBS 279.74]|uniref:Uncharacterized protein n=1 Tax=Pleomassaria siparia CBS 279.74 TaxID=1314801 RepID=A0A6G1KKF0_9PLEO|nr:hypothetical protein K504DRAFT_130525 [Pleomassaria siparia CBS 279.74]
MMKTKDSSQKGQSTSVLPPPPPPRYENTCEITSHRIPHPTKPLFFYYPDAHVDMHTHAHTRPSKHTTTSPCPYLPNAVPLFRHRRHTTRTEHGLAPSSIHARYLAALPAHPHVHSRRAPGMY